MRWYREHVRAVIAGVIVLILLSLTVASYISEGKNSWLGLQLGRMSTFLQEPVSAGGEGVSTIIKGIFQMKRLLNENELLSEENAKLKKDLIRLTLSNHDLAELKRLTEAMNYIDPSEKHTHVTAKVIAMDGSSWYKIFTINAGKEDGILINSVVINGDGLVGRVLDVGPNWSKVITVIDENNSVSFQVFRNLDIIGMLAGDGKGKITGYMLDEEASVIEGDLLVSSGMEIYPQGIPIGKISKITWDTDGLLHTVEIEPVVDFTKIQKVTVVMTGLENKEPLQQ